MNLYRIIAEDKNSGELSEISVMAEGNLQHIWDKINLVGVSHAGAKRLRAFLSQHIGSGWIDVCVGSRCARLDTWAEKEHA